MCDLNWNVVSSINLEPFESIVLLSCFCNNDVACNNRETIATCPADCTEICTDNIKNQDETDIDCGGVICSARCDNGESCSVDSDCLSGYCSGGICQAAIFPTDYIGYWKFDGDANDESIYHNDGTLIDGASIVTDTSPDNRGLVLSLDGSGDYVDMGDPLDNSLEIGNSTDILDFSVSAWVKTNYTGIQYISYKGGGSDIQVGWNFFIWDDFGYFALYLSNGTERLDSKSPGTANPADNQWHHLAAVVNKSGDNKIHYYMDGNDIGGADTITIIGSVFSSTPFRIGGYSGSFNGIIDDVMIYNRSLSTTEIQQIYCGQGGTAAFCS
jgi:hypothetical protein